MRPVTTPAAPTPAGHYAQAIEHAGLVYVAGQLPIGPDGTKVTGPIEEQTRAALDNLRAILEAAGSGLERVLRVTVYIADIGLWSRVNAVYSEYFGAHRPARTVIPTPPLHYGLLIEIDAIAALREQRP
ncbi:MAG: RidA family protein [Phycisphaerales bacterium]|nr:RidA family protein [Phycisphaerales bacterium]